MQKNPAIMGSLFRSASTLNADVVQKSHANPNFVCDSFFPHSYNEGALC